MHRGEVGSASAPARRHVKDIPDWPDQVDVTGLFAVVPGREHQLGRPPVAEPVAAACEHVQDRDLLAVRRFGMVVAVVVVVLRGQQPQMALAPVPGEGVDPGWI